MGRFFRSFGVGFPLGRELVLAQRTRLRTRFRISTNGNWSRKMAIGHGGRLGHRGEGASSSGTRRGERDLVEGIPHSGESRASNVHSFFAGWFISSQGE